MNEEKRNVILFFAISVLIMVGYPYFFNSDKPTIANQIVQESIEATNSTANQRNVRPVQKAEVKSIIINAKNLAGTISTRGAKIDTIYLKKYKENLDDEKTVSVFGNQEDKYFATVGWTSDDKSLILPNESTCWSTSSTSLTEKTPVTLTWDNGNGLIFEKRISVDDNFLITVEDSVKNYGDTNVTLKSCTRINRELTGKFEKAVSFYEGPLGYLNGKLEEISYEDIVKKHEICHSTDGGWFGVTDKYWLVAFIPNQKVKSEVFYRHMAQGNKNLYTVESQGETFNIAAGASASAVNHVFTGAKEVNTLDMYEEKLGIQHFDLAIDFGCLYILTKPLLYVLAYIKGLVGNMGLGIILITLLIKLLLFPLANKSYRSMNRMKTLQPKIKALQKKYGDDKVKLGQAVSELYKKEEINPIGGCLPLLLQSPVLFALYKVLYISIEMRQSAFIGWIHDLSLPDPLSIFNLFGLIPLNLPNFLQIGIWPMIMGLSMWLQQKMNPAPVDPSQEKMMLIMPIMFTFMFARLPVGLIVYWTISNILGIAQQYMIIKLDEKKRTAKQ